MLYLYAHKISRKDITRRIMQTLQTVVNLSSDRKCANVSRKQIKTNPSLHKSFSGSHS